MVALINLHVSSRVLHVCMGWATEGGTRSTRSVASMLQLVSIAARRRRPAGGGNIKALSSSLGASEEVHGTFFTR